MKYAFIQEHRHQYRIRRMCTVLSVSASGFYDWRGRSASKRSLRHVHLTGQIRTFFEESQQTYGAVRICRDLKEAGECAGKNTVALLMRKAGLLPKTIKRFRVTTDSRNTKAEPNRLDGQFTTDKPNHRW
ncbi:MAG: IS3 family transposase [Rhodobacteraceae bacterium]|nr:IS3 family transposase [Paracoccaceae bacterium]